MSDSWQFAWEISLKAFPFLIGLSGVALDIQLACSRHYPTLIESLDRSVALDRLKKYGEKAVSALGSHWYAALLRSPSSPSTLSGVDYLIPTISNDFPTI